MSGSGTLSEPPVGNLRGSATLDRLRGCPSLVDNPRQPSGPRRRLAGCPIRDVISTGEPFRRRQPQTLACPCGSSTDCLPDDCVPNVMRWFRATIAFRSTPHPNASSRSELGSNGSFSYALAPHRVEGLEQFGYGAGIVQMPRPCVAPTITPLGSTVSWSTTTFGRFVPSL